MADDKVPRPGMGQDEKDRLGLLALRAQEQGTWAADESLDDLTRDELEAEAAVRRVDVTDAKSKAAVVKALREVDTRPDRGRQPEAEPEPEPEPEPGREVEGDATAELDMTREEGA